MTEVEAFLLRRIAEEQHISIDTLHNNLTAPHGWFALVRLATEGYIFALGDLVSITDKGLEEAQEWPKIDKNIGRE